MVVALGLLLASVEPVFAAQGCVPHLIGADRRGLTWGVERSGDTLFVLSGAALLVYDVSDRWNPQQIGSTNLDDVGYGLALDGDVASVLGARSLRFVDVSDPENPVPGGSVTLPFAYYYGNGLAAEGGSTYLATGDGLRIFDATDPSSPVEIATLPEVRGSEVVLRWNRAYASTYEGLRILDVSDPAHPIETGLVPSVHGGVGISGSRNRMAVSSNPCGPRHCCTHVRFFDLSDPDLPLQRSDWWAPDESCPGAPAVLRNGRAYVFTQNEISILDLTDLSHPVELSSLAFGDWNYDAEASDSTLYVANVYSSLGILAVGDPSNVRVTAELKMPGESFAALVSEALGVVEHRHGVRTVDLSNPSHPEQLGARRFLDEYFWRPLAGYGDHVYAVGDRFGLRPFDLSDPSHPRARDPFGYGVHQLVREANRLYTYAGDLEVWDLADPDSPSLLGEYDEQFYAFSVDGTHLFGAIYGEDGYSVYDVGDPVHMHPIGHRPGVTGFGASVVRGDLHYFTNSSGLWVDDVSDPTAPQPLGALPFERAGDRLAAYGSRLFLPRWNSSSQDPLGVRVLDVSRPASPSIVADLDLPDHAYDVAVGPGFLLVADGEAGISVFDTCQPFADGFESGDASAWSRIHP